MWSNQVDHRFHFAVHGDGASDAAWSTSGRADRAERDDHINLKADGAGQVFAAVKTKRPAERHAP